MEREEHWRRRLLELKADLKVTQAAMAEDIDVDPSYMSRLLYPPGKPHRKNLGIDTLTALRRAYKLPADWFDLPLGAALPSGQHMLAHSPHRAESPRAGYVVDLKPERWPFEHVTFRRLMALKSALGPRVGAEAMRDIDALLDVAVAKWERIAKSKKKAS